MPEDSYMAASRKCGPGEFPSCGCHYTTDDDGVHFCPMHKAAPELLKICETVREHMVLLMAGLGELTQPSDVDITNALEAVIAKAKGVPK